MFDSSQDMYLNDEIRSQGEKHARKESENRRDGRSWKAKSNGGVATKEGGKCRMIERGSVCNHVVRVIVRLCLPMVWPNNLLAGNNVHSQKKEDKGQRHSAAWQPALCSSRYTARATLLNCLFISSFFPRPLHAAFTSHITIAACHCPRLLS